MGQLGYPKEELHIGKEIRVGGLKKEGVVVMKADSGGGFVRLSNEGSEEWRLVSSRNQGLVCFLPEDCIGKTVGAVKIVKQGHNAVNGEPTEFLRAVRVRV